MQLCDIDDIKIINNFISTEDLDIFNKEIHILRSNNLIKRSKFCGRIMTENVNIPSLLPLFKKYNKKIIDTQKTLFSITKNISAVEVFVSIFEPGDYISDHIDSDGSFSFFEYASVMYLNDFESGEICFPLLNFKYKPLAGDLILFPCNGKKSLHNTLTSKNERITIASWYGFFEKGLIKCLEE